MLEFEVVKPHVINFLKKNYWKVKDLMDWDDAIGEAQLQFVRTIDRLEKRGCVIENEKHLMSLFKTSWSRHFITLANKATKERFVSTMQDGTAQELSILNMIGENDNTGLLEAQLAKAPTEVKQVLRLLVTAPDELVEELQKSFHQNRKACNQKLCKLLNKNPNSVDLVQIVLDRLGLE